MMPVSTPRRYDLDWLRSIVILNLIPYHAAFLILAVPEFSLVATEGLIALLLGLYLLVFTPLHMPLMFTIAGYSLVIATRRKPLRAFLIERFQRLVIPLVALTVLLMPIAAYALPVVAQISAPNPLSIADYFGRYWPEYLANLWTVSITGGPLWLHLWFLAYLTVMTAIATPVVYAVQRCVWSRDQTRTMPGCLAFYPQRLGVLLLGLTLIGFLIALLLAPIFPFYRFNLIGDWAYFFYNSTGFVLGIVLALTPQSLEAAKPDRVGLTLIAFITLIVRLAISVYGVLHFDIDLPEVYAAQLPENLYRLYAIVTAINTWTTIVVLWIWGQTTWNRPHQILARLSQRSYSYYIWHFVILCLVGLPIVQWRLGILSEFIVLCLVTIVGCILADELIVRRWAIGRLLFGVKPIRPPVKP